MGIYFDNGSTSFPKAPGVGEAIATLIENGAFNINRGNYRGAYDVAYSVLDCRERLCRMFNGEDSKYVIFTPGITYSINFFMKGFLKPGDHFIITSMEHNAVSRTAKQLEEIGCSYSMLQADVEGMVNPDDLYELINEKTKAVVMLHASNVSGTVLPIEEIGAICKEKGLVFAVDTAQTAGTLPIDMKKCNIDFLAFTAHKGLLGPQGIGGFVIAPGMEDRIEPVITGGTGSKSDSLEMPTTLPDRYESGTMNLPGIIGLRAALVYLEETGIENIHKKKMEIAEYFMKQLEKFEHARIAGPKTMENRVAVVSVDFEGSDNAMVAFELENKHHIMTRVGMHCAPLAHQSLHTFPQGTVRFAFSASNTKEEVDECIKALEEIGV